MADTVEAFLSRLHHPVLAGIDLSLDRMRRLLQVLGSPEKRLPPVIHVAGTNGKGSLIAYLHAIFEAAGYRVHRYISPHLVHFSERIVLQGREIDHARLEPILRHVASLLPNYPATFFEATTAAAFLAFVEKPADILLLETGMGGRLDATNVIAKPLLTAITPISLDHMEYLGNSIAAIAAEKAGILKRGIPCVVGKQQQEALRVIENAADKLSAPLHRCGREWQVADGIYQSPQRQLTLHPALAGAFQYDNAATAVACIEQLPGFAISDEQMVRGLESAIWPARLQHITQGRYVEMLPAGMELWLDGGHNPQGAQVLAEWMQEQLETPPPLWGRLGGGHSRSMAGNVPAAPPPRPSPYRGGRIKKIHLICGMIRGKDGRAFLQHLAPYVRSLQAVPIEGEQLSQPPEQVAAAAQAVGLEAAASPSVRNALQTIVAHAKTPSIICICGSLYLAGKVLAVN